MNLSPAGLHLIAGFEGYRPGWYDDGTGVETIGYGHTGALPAGITAPLTASEGLELLRDDAAQAVAAVNKAIRVKLGVEPLHAQARFDALVSLCFNIGAGAFAASSLVRAINEHGAPRDWHEVAPLWLEWDHAGGVIMPGLLDRRRREVAIFVPGRYP